MSKNIIVAVDEYHLDTFKNIIDSLDPDLCIIKVGSVSFNALGHEAVLYSANKGFDIAYNAEFANIFNNWNFLVETQFTSPNYSVNFYNFGNETLNFENDFNKNYHRVRISKYVINPFLKWKFNEISFLGIILTSQHRGISSFCASSCK